MNILIAYATNSGGTFFATQTAEKILKSKRHLVTRKEIEETSASEFKNFDFIIFASPSWNYEGAEGELQKSFKTFVQSYSGSSLKNKKCAVLGLGDSSYLYFCGAADRLEKFVQENGAYLTLPSLRIDGYYKDEEGHNKLIEDWIERILS